MQRTSNFQPFSRRVLLVFSCTLAFSVMACDNDVNFNPTTPSFPFTASSPGNAGAGRNLEIRGSLAVERGSCIEATVLFDGKEVDGARATCSRDAGCSELALAAVVQSDTGRHTISFQVVRQSSTAILYDAAGTVRVGRDGLPWTVTLPLGPTRANLRAGESVTFDVEIWN